MALKHGSSSGVAYADVMYALQAFEVLNKCRLVVQLHTQGQGKQLSLVLELVAYDVLQDPAEVKPLASQKYVVGSHSPQTMEAAILQGLYSLDAQLAAGELVRGDRQSA